ncbi:uncharacterized protein LOC113334654 [Papaver somniferum]|uniref:uncharacterized protein LOC113334654 n=1 Tax=Papaver somniferum TaxID=3469 RepID=UPI000E70179F|nr:uncharacterized protein LOC113334654 [Papaver somniferum]
MEEVLSKKLTQLVNEGKISPTVIRKGIRPTHLFFPDDVFMFCNGGKKTLQKLLQLLDEYQKCSGQIINNNKSKLFIDGTNDSRKSLIQDIIQMERSDFPDKYLGVILSADRVKTSIVWPMVEMLQSKLAAWKGIILYFQERLVLIKWPSYPKTCSNKHGIFDEDDVENHALEDWAAFFKAKYMDKNGQWSNAWKLSTAWTLESGNGEDISVWHEVWIRDTPLVDKMGSSQFFLNNKMMKLADILNEGTWSIPSEIQVILMNQKLPEIYRDEDEVIWNGDIKGTPTMPDATNKLRHKEPKKHWSRYVWNNFLHPSISSNIWKLVQGSYIDDAIMVSNGYELASRCCVCEKEQDSMNHLLWECSVSVEIWEYGFAVFNFKAPESFEEVWRCAKNKSPLIQEIWIIASCAILKQKKWFQKNRKYFEEIKPNAQGATGFGVVIMDEYYQVIGTLCGGLGIATNYIAVNYAVLCAAELAMEWGLS